MNKLSLRIGISIGATLLLIAHHVFPREGIDVTTTGLVLICFLPWLAALVEQAKLPGGWEIRFRDLEPVGRLIPAGKGAKAEPLLEIAELDANLALVYLRIEIEKRLRRLAEAFDIKEKMPLLQLFREIRKQQAIDTSGFGGLEEVVMAGNNAAHGASVDPALANWAMDYGPQIIAYLDSTIDDAKRLE